ncbi:MAG: cyclase family protein [Verrucomicrobia bacterium]|nr:cyclase family protein [Verrucomicrobiota bacterium]
MCSPLCLEALYGSVSRRSFVGKSVVAAAAVACGVRVASGSPAAKLAAQQSPTSFTNVLDLTHPLYEGFPTLDGSKWFTKEKKFTFAKERLNINTWTVVEHTGTHMDAPLHFTADGHSVDEIPITDLVVPLAVIDISQRAKDNADTALTPDDVKKWESANGPLPEGCCVMMNSGWGRLLDSPQYTGRDDAGKNHCPGFHGETAHMLLTERNVKGIGVDTLSLDTGLETGEFPVHYAWLGSGRWGVEAVANLDALPAKGAILVLGGPKVRGGTGGPSRVIALV